MSLFHASKCRILISNLGSLGDIIPFLDIGKTLLGRDHDVTFATTPKHRVQIEASGLIFRAIGSARRTRTCVPIRNLSDWLPSPDRLGLTVPLVRAAPARLAAAACRSVPCCPMPAL
ncbi:glycosyltransferase [Methylobacterium goesingense]|uniref:UDP:flavonoid glycosyltransferase YjiC (YdhE family) n=1 Tax=Methylobacterium goesingense TaxID=243690 RepID=A0ABV2LFG7_9HYPH|nr:glycosyltransferase [Methylobacterium goesingense]GJD75074.1 hypothetical protein CFIICLFH_3314 [Methylobacterium goesingense]